MNENHKVLIEAIEKAIKWVEDASFDLIWQENQFTRVGKAMLDAGVRAGLNLIAVGQEDEIFEDNNYIDFPQPIFVNLVLKENKESQPLIYGTIAGFGYTVTVTGYPGHYEKEDKDEYFTVQSSLKLNAPDFSNVNKGSIG